MKYRVDATLIHETTDHYALSVDVEYKIPQFFIEAENEQSAEQMAKAIICPVDLQYESVAITINITGV